MIKPFENYLVLEEENATELESGIVLTDTANVDRPNIAKVIVTGPDVKKVKKDERVLFKYHLFDEITLEKKKYLVGKDEGVIGLF